MQITDLLLYRMAYEGFVRELEKNGLVRGKNLVINRTVIGFDIENPNVWKKMKGVLAIKREASRIASEKPDLVLTIGAPVTKYSRSRITDAGIPLVFTAVVFPKDIGSKSMTEGGPGLTGASSYMDLNDAMKIVRQNFPNLKKLGLVHSMEVFSHLDEATGPGRAHGFTIMMKQVGMTDPILPALEDLKIQGVQAFVVPPDPFYSVRNGKAVSDLVAFSREHGIPVISFVIADVPGAVLSLGVDLEKIGALSGQQAVKILKGGAKPESLPILRQRELTVRIDEKLKKTYGMEPSSGSSARAASAR